MWGRPALEPATRAGASRPLHHPRHRANPIHPNRVEAWLNPFRTLGIQGLDLGALGKFDAAKLNVGPRTGRTATAQGKAICVAFSGTCGQFAAFVRPRATAGSDEIIVAMQRG